MRFSCLYIKQCPAVIRTSCSINFPHPAVSVGQVKPIVIGGCRISASGKLLHFPFEDSGSALFKRVGSTTLQITNSAGKNLLSRHITASQNPARRYGYCSHSLLEKNTAKNNSLQTYYQNLPETAAKNSWSNYFSRRK